MKKSIIMLLFLCFCPMLHAGFFQRERATVAAQKGEWQEANKNLSRLVTDYPDVPDLLYDAGVASFQLSEFEKARAYFKNVSTCVDVSVDLQEQAHFNLGNTDVELKQLESAITQYETVLKINPENEKAKHNLEIVKKMLEEQQQDQQQQDQQQDQQNSQDKKDQDQQKEQQNKNDQNDQSSEGKQGDKQDNDDRQSEGGSQDDKQQEERQDDRRDESGQQPNADSDRNQERDASDESEREQDKQEQKDDRGHEDSPEQKQNQQSDSQDTQQSGKEQENESSSAAKHQSPEYDPQIMRILKAIEEKDAQANKKMMAAQVKQAAGSYDKNQNNY